MFRLWNLYKAHFGTLLYLCRRLITVFPYMKALLMTITLMLKLKIKKKSQRFQRE